ncbi:MAG: filamentous hemagglutinin N-terminal domain-containing protein [Leptolyngbyaceae cyanobacterium]
MNYPAYAPLLVSVAILGMGGGVLSLPADAQIIPDQTLGPESSVVESDNLGVDRIQGGATRGSNLFHSFEQFDISPAQQVYFSHPIGIETILGRVTGTDHSEIMGTLGVDGNADLFLLNPNGIVFGPDARLDVGGSFVTTSADALQFREVGTFSGRDPETPSPLLTIAPSAFLFGPEPAGRIVNRSTVTTESHEDFPGLSVGLRVPNGEDLLFVGGNVILDGGRLSAFGGRVGIGSATGEGTVALGSDRTLIFPDNLLRGTVRLQNDARVEATLDGGGDIQVVAGKIRILSSLLRTGIQARLGTVDSQAGDITLDATERIIADGRFEADDGLTPGALNVVLKRGVGNGGDITIATPILRILNGAQIGSDIRGTGNGGRVIITASERVAIDDTLDRFSTSNPTVASNMFPSGIFSDIVQGGEGNAGSVTITTPILDVLNGSLITSAVFGTGSAGQVIITATERITLNGISGDGEIPSGIFTDTVSASSGNAGSITITTPILNVLNEAQIGSGTFGNGDGGSVIINATERITIDSEFAIEGSPGGIFSEVDSRATGDAGRITITTPILDVLNGGQIGSNTFSRGNAGQVTIVATESITIDGASIFDELATGIFSDVNPDAVGNAGEINITTPILRVLNRALINSESQGDGNAGEINVTTDLLVLDNESNILTQTRSGNGGDIDVNVGNLLMSGNSGISSEAGTEEAGGDGGDMAISSRFIVATQNSDINANAFTGSGGNIDIIASGGLLGIEFRPQQTSNSDITASSQFGVDGNVVINTPGIDPSQGIIELPVTPIETLPLDVACVAARSGSEFIITGRGGIPTSPLESLGSGNPWEDWYIASPLTPDQDSHHHTNRDSAVLAEVSPPLVEAQGWHQTNDGHIQLVAAVPPFAITTDPSAALDCSHLP